MSQHIDAQQLLDEILDGKHLNDWGASRLRDGDQVKFNLEELTSIANAVLARRPNSDKVAEALEFVRYCYSHPGIRLMLNRKFDLLAQKLLAAPAADSAATEQADGWKEATPQMMDEARAYEQGYQRGYMARQAEEVRSPPAERAAGPKNLHSQLFTILQDFLIPEDECNSVDFDAIYSRKSEQELLDLIRARLAAAPASADVGELLRGDVLAAAAKAVADSAEVWTGFSISDAKTCIRAALQSSRVQIKAIPPPEVVRPVIKALRDDAAGNSKATMTDIDLAVCWLETYVLKEPKP